jgi:hypothetical protein
LVAIIVASGAPLLYVAWLANPVVIIVLGREAWSRGGEAVAAPVVDSVPDGRVRLLGLRLHGSVRLAGLPIVTDADRLEQSSGKQWAE